MIKLPLLTWEVPSLAGDRFGDLFTYSIKHSKVQAMAPPN
jgi:hypothetical protein